MAFPEDVILNTGDLTHPTVTAKVASDGYEKGIDSNYVPWRVVEYQIFDLENVSAGHLSDLFMDALMGNTSYAPFGSFTLENYRPAHRYPGNRQLACEQVVGKHEGVGKGGDKLHETNYATIRATYRRASFSSVGTDASGYVVTPEDDNPGAILGIDGEPIPYVTVRKTKGSKTITIDRSSIKSDDSTSPMARGFQLTIPLVTYHLTYHKVPWNGDDFDDALFNRVNNAVIWGKAVGTLRYDGSEADPVGIGGGVMGYDVMVDVTWNQLGWNYDIPAGKDEPEKIVFVDDDTKTPYLGADFSILQLAEAP